MGGSRDNQIVIDGSFRLFAIADHFRGVRDNRRERRLKQDNSDFQLAIRTPARPGDWSCAMGVQSDLGGAKRDDLNGLAQPHVVSQASPRRAGQKP